MKFLLTLSIAKVNTFKLCSHSGLAEERNWLQFQRYWGVCCKILREHKMMLSWFFSDINFRNLVKTYFLWFWSIVTLVTKIVKNMLSFSSFFLLFEEHFSLYLSVCYYRVFQSNKLSIQHRFTLKRSICSFDLFLSLEFFK